MIDLPTIGFNKIILTGHVGSINTYETTHKKDTVLTFMLCVEEEENDTVWIKVNAYKKIADKLKKYLNKGDFVLVEGKIINRKIRSSELVTLELKATHKVNILQKKQNRKDDF